MRSMTADELQTATGAELFQMMTRAYNHQAHVVDSGGSDDASYAAENRCKRIEKEIERRGLDYFAWVDNQHG